MKTLKRYAPALVFFLVVVAATPWLIGPPCPKRVVIATGSKEGAYFAFAQRYQEILARNGVTLEIRCTDGSVENERLLSSDDSDVSLAIIQGGVSTGNTDGECEWLASLYLEPVWVFHRRDMRIDQLKDLSGARIAVGRPDSGTHALALSLLTDNDVATDADCQANGTELVKWGGERAALALKAGEIDAAFFVVAPKSSLVRELLATESVELMNFRRAAAYQRKHPFLSAVTLCEGMIDLKRNIPNRDITLLAPAANLAARSDLHDAIVPLILGATTQVHSRGSFQEEQGVFPSLKHVDGPVNADARRFFRSGPPLFYRLLPFRVAVRLDQMKLLALPLFTLLLPLLKAAPPIYRWSIRSKIYRWYGVLREVDVKLNAAAAGSDFSDDMARLREVEDELAKVSVPLSYMEEAYNLRMHVAYLLDRMAAIQGESQPRQSTPRLRRAA